MFFYISILIIAVITFLTMNLIRFKKIEPFKRTLEKRIITVQNKLKNYEFNIHAPNIFCSQDAFESKLYMNGIPEIINENLFLYQNNKFELKKFKVVLQLSNQGNLEYFLNNVLIWTSKHPHEFFQTFDTEIMMKKFEESNVFEFSDLILHLYPLRIEYKNKIIWGFWGGYDPTSFCENDLEINNCSIPIRDSNKGKTFLFSENRIYRISLHENGDLIILKTTADEKNMYKWSKKIEYSFIEKFCKQ